MRSFKFCLLSCMFFFAGCDKQISFDKEKWPIFDEDGDYAFRNEMLEDLVANHKLIGLRSFKIHELLGNEDDGGPYEYEYKICDIYPFFGRKKIKILDFELNKDSLVTSVKILEKDDDF